MSNVLWKYQWFPFYSYRYDALDEMVFNFSELSIFNGEHRHPVQTREKKNSYTKILNAITSIYDEHISNVFQFEWIEWAHFYRMCLNREILDLLPRIEMKRTTTLTHLWDVIIENTWNWKTKSATIWKYVMEFVFLYLFSCDHLMQIKNEYTDFSAL